MSNKKAKKSKTKSKTKSKQTAVSSAGSATPPPSASGRKPGSAGSSSSHTKLKPRDAIEKLDALFKEVRSQQSNLKVLTDKVAALRKSTASVHVFVQKERERDTFPSSLIEEARKSSKGIDVTFDDLTHYGPVSLQFFSEVKTVLSHRKEYFKVTEKPDSTKSDNMLFMSTFPQATVQELGLNVLLPTKKGLTQSQRQLTDRARTVYGHAPGGLYPYLTDELLPYLRKPRKTQKEFNYEISLPGTEINSLTSFHNRIDALEANFTRMVRSVLTNRRTRSRLGVPELSGSGGANSKRPVTIQEIIKEMTRRSQVWFKSAKKRLIDPAFLERDAVTKTYADKHSKAFLLYSNIVMAQLTALVRSYLSSLPLRLQETLVLLQHNCQLTHLYFSSVEDINDTKWLQQPWEQPFRYWSVKKPSPLKPFRQWNRPSFLMLKQKQPIKIDRLLRGVPLPDAVAMMNKAINDLHSWSGCIESVHVSRTGNVMVKTRIRGQEYVIKATAELLEKVILSAIEMKKRQRQLK